MTPEERWNRAEELYDANDPVVDKAIRYVGQDSDNVRHARAVVILWIARWLKENGEP